VSKQSTRQALPTWEVLLYLYGVLVLPLVFALLVGLNLVAWASARINYVFIFGNSTCFVYLGELKWRQCFRARCSLPHRPPQILRDSRFLAHHAHLQFLAYCPSGRCYASDGRDIVATCLVLVRNCGDHQPIANYAS
jgi:hypothetical protein